MENEIDTSSKFMMELIELTNKYLNEANPQAIVIGLIMVGTIVGKSCASNQEELFRTMNKTFQETMNNSQNLIREYDA